MYNFDEVIDRRHGAHSYSAKWADTPQLRRALDVDDINDDTIALFTADMDFRCAPPIRAALRAAAEHGVYGYSTPPPAYFEAVTDWFSRRRNWTFAPDNVVYVDGTVRALTELIRAFSAPGDGVILQRPVYAPFTSVILAAGRSVVNSPLLADESGTYTMDFDDLAEKAARPSSKILLLCHPHNPVGRVWTEEELMRAAEICRRNGVLIVSDEVHGDLVRRDTRFRPLASLVGGDGVITATAVSKSFNLAGLHGTNLVISDRAVRERLAASMGEPLPSPFTIAAVIAAYTQGEDWLDALLGYLDGSIDWILDFLRRRMPEVICRRPEGTYILWMDFRRYGLSSREIHDLICRGANVLLDAGTKYDPKRGGGFERVCVPSPRSVLAEAFGRIADCFDRR